jgi:hypothetical protein
MISSMKRAKEIHVCIAAAVLCSGIATAAPANISPMPLAKKAVHHHCDQCGVVESTRYVGASRGQAAYFEFVVRMRDGSIRTSRVDSLYKWRTGDHVMIGGGAASSP